MIYLLAVIYYMLPAYFANMAPVIFKKINFLNVPINENLFGRNKTYRGLFFAVLLGTVVFLIQKSRLIIISEFQF